MLDVAAEGIAEDDELHDREDHRHDDQHRAAPEPPQLAFDDRPGSRTIAHLRDHERAVGGRGFLQRVAQRTSGVVHEHIVERGALHGQRLNRDAASAPPLHQRHASSPVRWWRDAGTRARAGDIVRRRAAPRAGCPGVGHWEKLASSTFLLGIEAFSVIGESSAIELAVIDDGDAIAELVGFVHVVRRERTVRSRCALMRLSISQTATREPDRGRWSARRERKCAARAPDRARSRRGAACRPRDS